MIKEFSFLDFLNSSKDELNKQYLNRYVMIVNKATGQIRRTDKVIDILMSGDRTSPSLPIGFCMENSGIVELFDNDVIRIYE